jgi:acetyl-CoA acetyltransferase
VLADDADILSDVAAALVTCDEERARAWSVATNSADADAALTGLTPVDPL